MQTNWSIWAQIEQNIQNYCKSRWDEPATAADVLSGGGEIFAVRHTGGDYPLPRLIRFGQLCCRCSARKQGYSRAAREVTGWDTLPEPQMEGYRRGQDHASDLAELSGLDADFLRREARLQEQDGEQMDLFVGQWGYVG